MFCQRNCNQSNYHLSECSVTDCGGCLPALSEPGMNVCAHCVDKFNYGMKRLVDGWDSLEDKLVKSTNYRFHDRVTGSAGPGSVMNENVFETKVAVRDWVVFVVRILATEFSADAPESDTKSMLKWVFLHSAQLLGHELAGAFVDDVQGLVRTLVGAVTPQPKRKFPLPATKCFEAMGGVVCGADVVVVTRYQTGRSFMEVRCTQGHVRALEAFLVAVAPAEAGVTLSAREAGLLLGVDSKQVSVLASRNAWATIGVDGRKVYELSDVTAYLMKKGN